jgi:hypothetical protein
MEAIGIPYNDCSPHYLCNELGWSVAVTTYLQILGNVEWTPRSGANEPKRNGQFLTVVTQMKHLFLFLYTFVSGTYPASFIWLVNVFSSA